MPSRRLASLEARRQALLLRSELQRETVAALGARIVDALSPTRFAMDAVRKVRARPFTTAGVALLLGTLGTRRSLALLGRVAILWPLISPLRRIARVANTVFAGVSRRRAKRRRGQGSTAER